MNGGTLRNETIREDGGVRMTREVDHIWWVTRSRNRRVAVRWSKATENAVEV